MLSGLIGGGALLLILLVSFFMYRRYRKAQKKNEITLNKAEQQIAGLERQNIDDIEMEMTSINDGDLVYDLDGGHQGQGQSSSQEDVLRKRNEALARDNLRMKKEIEKRDLNMSGMDLKMPRREVKMDPEDELEL